ncbi:MAG: hydrolase 1, exosortase A system-associated [Sphingomonas sp.]|uniref:hydrolase 1, exosortase A system-associated n=1 Tax=Sphingomonas sp. TaxID=28214 RepID=UPI001B29F79D|nr:hydrolase 1, exosortase A system-associated [Sphingomonas sp.]MBO9623608.1 hydrolase 1, exosortase A system-associated [Sphingomonas sp.]
MRRLIAFPCAGETLAGTLDEAPGTTGLLIVSGGNEIRIGAHRGMALLAQRVAEAGYPVFRFDRRGIGDSTGANGGFESSAEDIAAAVRAFRQEAPHLTRILAYGNCDAATALALFHGAAGIDVLLLANPWIVEDEDGLPSPAAIRARYASRVRDPREWLRLLRGQVNLRKLVKGLSKASKIDSQVSSLAARVAAAFAEARVPITLLIAEQDNTAVAFLHAYRAPAFDAVRSRIPVEKRVTASHSFASAEDKEWLFRQVLKSLA